MSQSIAQFRVAGNGTITSACMCNAIDKDFNYDGGFLEGREEKIHVTDARVKP